MSSKCSGTEPPPRDDPSIQFHRRFGVPTSPTLPMDVGLVLCNIVTKGKVLPRLITVVPGVPRFRVVTEEETLIESHT